MKWKTKPDLNPKYGDKRYKLKFALLPKKINDHTIWLEYYYSVQKYQRLDNIFLNHVVMGWVEESRY